MEAIEFGTRYPLDDFAVGVERAARWAIQVKRLAIVKRKATQKAGKPHKEDGELDKATKDRHTATDTHRKKPVVAYGAGIHWDAATFARKVHTGNKDHFVIIDLVPVKRKHKFLWTQRKKIANCHDDIRKFTDMECIKKGFCRSCVDFFADEGVDTKAT